MKSVKVLPVTRTGGRLLKAVSESRVRVLALLALMTMLASVGFELTAAGETSGLSSLTSFSAAPGLTSNLSASVSFPAGTSDPPCPDAPVTLAGSLTNVSAGNYTYQWWRGTQPAADPAGGWPNNGFTAMPAASGSFSVTGVGGDLSATPVAVTGTTADAQFYYVLQVSDDGAPTPQAVYSQFGPSTLHVDTRDPVTAGDVTADPGTIMCDSTGAGVPLTLTTTAGGDGPYTYTWEACPNDRFNPVNSDVVKAGTSTPSATESYTFNARAGDPDKYYRVTVAGSCNTASAIIGPIKVHYPVKNIVQPQNASTTVGVAATFTSSASGNPAPTVQWQKLVGATWTDVTGNPTATTNTLTVTPKAVSEDGTQYRATFTNTSKCGVATGVSNAATLAVGKGAATVNLANLIQTYDGAAKFATATTTPPGLSAAVGYSQGGSPVAAPTDAGSYDVAATVNDVNYQGGATGTLVINKADQVITFGALATKTFGDAPFAVSATGGASGNPVTFSVTGNCSAGGVNGSTITLTSAGSCTVTAAQAGGGNYNAAAPVVRTFQIDSSARQNQTIAFAALPNRTFGDAPFTVAATGGASGNAVTFSAEGACTAGGVNGSTITIVGAGACTVTASQASDANYNAAADVRQSFQIARASTSASVSSSANPSASGQGATFKATVTSAAGVPTGAVQFTADGADLGAAVTLDAGGVATLTTSGLAPGAHAIAASYGGDVNFTGSAGALDGAQVVGGVFEFSQAAYAVSERGGSVAITVRRTGDAGSAMTVDYVTDGNTPTAAVPCSAATGVALERCDYNRAAGTLQFAAGETEKSFTVLVNDDSYAEGAESLGLALSNPAGGASLGAQSSSALQLADDLPESVGNPVDDSQFFVRQHYHDFLNREPDADGLAFWVGNITPCGADAACVASRRVNVSAAFYLSIEFKETGYFVYRLYKAAFGNLPGKPVPVAFRQFLRDTQEIGRGVIVGRQGWEQQLEANKQAFADALVRRAAFQSAYPSTTGADDLIAKLDQNAGGVLLPEERAALVAALAPASTDASKRAQVLRAVAENQALQRQEFNRAFVLMQYFGYLQRDPDDAPDSDFSGFSFWLSKLEQFGGDFRRAEMVKAFISATEYRQRFGQ